MRNLHAALPASLALSAAFCLPLSSVAQSKAVSDAQVEAAILKGFAANSQVAGQPISTSTSFGVVTLSGSVGTDAARDAAEQIASHTPGVKKVVDQLTVGPTASTNGTDPAAGNSVLLSDGTRGSATPDASGSYPSVGTDASQQSDTQPYPQQSGTYPPDSNQAQVANAYPNSQGAYPPSTPPRLYRRDYERQMAAQQGGYGQQGTYGQQGVYDQQGSYGQPYQQGQPGGVLVTVPDGTVLPVAINRWISSGDAQPGSTFTALVSNDVLANGQIAIPRGATVEGTVVDAKGAGVLKGRGMLTLQLNTLDLGGQRIPLQSDTFTVEGRDKAARSVTSTILGAGIGALFGAAIGRGTGAAIGAGVGGAAGLGTSAASNSNQAVLRPEEMLRFRLTAPTQVTTVSEAEMQRLGGYAGPSQPVAPAVPPPYGYAPYAVGAYPYPVAVGVYGSPYPYPYRYYRRGFYRGYWY